MIRFLPGPTEARVATLVEEAVEGHTPGIDLGTVKRSTTFTTTNTNSASTAGDIPSASIVVTGTGRPVTLRFHCAAVWHSVANTLVSVAIVCNGDVNNANSQRGGVVSPSAAIGPSLDIVHDTDVLTDGVQYTFTVRIYGGAAGTCNLFAAAAYKIALSATSR